MPFMSFDYFALPPEVNIHRLLSGPGVAALTTAAAAYADLAAGLAAAASGTDGSTVMIGGAWQGPSSDRAQAAFRQHAGWLHRQSVVAMDAAKSAAELGTIFGEAEGAMLGVEAWLAEWYAKQAALAAASTTQLAPLTLGAMAASELEYLAIWGAAAGVMAGYDGAASAVLAGLPTPEVPLPIVNGGPGLESAPNLLASPDITNPLATDTGHTNQDVVNHQTGDTGRDPVKSNPDPTDTSQPSDTTQPADTTQPTDTTQPVDTTQPTDQLPDMDNPSLSDSLANSGMDGSGSFDQQGLLGASQNSTTLAGLYGGAGSMAALNMARGGLSAMPGAASGFRMPSNWSLGRGTAFGASPNPTGGGLASRPTAPRGATAPKAQMRRRRRDEDRKKSKVFVPGEPQEVPVLEEPPIIGVIAYGDADRRDEPDEPDNEQLLLVGVIGNTADEPATADQEPAR
ncbi:PPE domain-containing protein [Nocardia sp. NPDC004260]